MAISVMAGGLAIGLLILAIALKSSGPRMRRTGSAGSDGSSAAWMGDGGGDAGCDSSSGSDGGCSDGGGGGGGD